MEVIEITGNEHTWGIVAYLLANHKDLQNVVSRIITVNGEILGMVDGYDRSNLIVKMVTDGKFTPGSIRASDIRSISAKPDFCIVLKAGSTSNIEVHTDPPPRMARRIEAAKDTPQGC